MDDLEYHAARCRLPEDAWKRNNGHGVMWRVVADHPTLRRPDKGNMPRNEAMAYANSLKPLGYKNISVIKEASHVNGR